MKMLICMTLAALLAVSAASAHAADRDPEKLRSFADHLFDQGDYYRAITEYERLIFYYPDHALAETSRYQIALSYFKGDKLDIAAIRFRELAETYKGRETGADALFMLAETYYRKKEFMRAGEIVEDFLKLYPTNSRADSARIKLGWCYMQQGDWRAAAAEFRKLPEDSDLRKQAEGLAARSAEYDSLPRKSPYLAGALSAILPGAGQLYIGRPGDAALSFLLNGAFIYATTQSFRNNDTATGAILLLFESGWYFGNVYNAVNGAHKFNQRTEQEYFNSLQGRFGVSYQRDGHGTGSLVFVAGF